MSYKSVLFRMCPAQVSTKYTLFKSLLPSNNKANINALGEVVMTTLSSVHQYSTEFQGSRFSCKFTQRVSDLVSKASSACLATKISKNHLCPSKVGTRHISRSSVLTSFPKVFTRTIVEIVLLLCIDTNLRSKQ